MWIFFLLTYLTKCIYYLLLVYGKGFYIVNSAKNKSFSQQREIKGDLMILI